MATFQLNEAQEAMYDEGGWAYARLMEDINETLDRKGIHAPVAIVAADGLGVLCWLSAERQ
jgi:hypothetical protein